MVSSNSDHLRTNSCSICSDNLALQILCVFWFPCFTRIKTPEEISQEFLPTTLITSICINYCMFKYFEGWSWPHRQLTDPYLKTCRRNLLCLLVQSWAACAPAQHTLAWRLPLQKCHKTCCDDIAAAGTSVKAGTGLHMPADGATHDEESEFRTEHHEGGTGWGRARGREGEGEMRWGGTGQIGCRRGRNWHPGHLLASSGILAPSGGAWSTNIDFF